MRCHYLDAAEFATPSKEDGLHMDASGHAALAKAMYEKVKEILGIGWLSLYLLWNGEIVESEVER